MNKFRFGEDPFLDKLIREQEIDIKKEKYDNLLKFLHGNAENLRIDMHIPIKNDCRIDENSFKRVIPEEEIETDKKKIEKIKNGWMNPEKNKEALGEKMEVFKTALFQKFMGKDYITIRSSEFDDIVNHTDNVIIDKKTGDIVSAFDEVMIENESFGNERKIEKMAKIKRLNQEGIHLKYGVRLAEQINPKTKIKEKIVKVDKETKVPIFCLSLSRENLQKGIENFDNEEISHNIFNSFMSNLKEQIEEMGSHKSIPEHLTNKMVDFKKSLEEKKYIKK